MASNSMALKWNGLSHHDRQFWISYARTDSFSKLLLKIVSVDYYFFTVPLVHPKIILLVKLFQTSLWNNLHPNQVIGTAAIIKEIDCLTVTVNDILNVRASISSSISAEETRFCGFAGWFDVHFRVSSTFSVPHCDGLK